MPTNNKYSYRSRISESKFRQIVSYYTLDLSASQIAELSKLNRNTVNSILMGIRKCIAHHYCCDEKIVLEFPSNITTGPQLPCGFSIEDQKICMFCSQRDLFNNQLSSNDGKRPNILFDLSTLGFIKLSSGSTKSEEGLLNAFIALTTEHLSKMKGLSKEYCSLHLCEVVFRFNCRKDDKYHILLEWIRKHPLNSSSWYK